MSVLRSRWRPAPFGIVYISFALSLFHCDARRSVCVYEALRYLLLVYEALLYLLLVRRSVVPRLSLSHTHARLTHRTHTQTHTRPSVPPSSSYLFLPFSLSLSLFLSLAPSR